MDEADGRAPVPRSLGPRRIQALETRSLGLRVSPGPKASGDPASRPAEPQAAEPSAEEDDEDEEVEGAEEDFFESAEAGTDEEEPLRESVR